MKINKIFFICLASENDRVNNVNNVIKNLNWEHQVDIHYVGKLDHLYEDTDLVSNVHKYLNQTNDVCSIINHWSCTLNHYNIISEAYFLNYDNILVCEDDIFILDNNKFLILLDNIPADADFIQYEYSKEIYNGSNFSPDENIIIPYNDLYDKLCNIHTTSTQCIYLSRKMINFVYNYYRYNKITYADEYQYKYKFTKFEQVYNDLNVYVPKNKILQNWKFKSCIL